MVGLASQTVLALYEGRFSEAEALAQRALAVGRRFSSPTAEGVHGLQMFVLRRAQGRLGEVLPLLEHFVQATPAAAIWRPGLALIYAELEMAEEARRELEALARDDFATIARDGMWSTNMVFLVEVCAYLGDANRARVLYRMLSPLAGRNCVSGAHSACFGSVDRFLGMLASAAGDRDAAERHFEAALGMDARGGGRPGLAQTQYCYAALLARQRERGTERALGLLSAAVDTARELGMAALEKRCLALKDKLEGRLAYPDGLSKREVDVLHYLATGKGNREIGELLFISANTVANHIQSILAKTGAANRTEAAAYAIRHRLVRGSDRAS
jgi:DNA-binding CsgD family transcriptional regulator